MTLTAMDIYWVLMLPKLGLAICWVAFFLLIVGVGLFAYYAEERSQERKEKEPRTFAKVWGWILVPGAIMLWLAGFAVPERNHLIAMYVIPPIVNNVGVQKMPENLVNLINKELESALDALDKKKEDGKNIPPKAEAPKADTKADLNEDLKKIAADAALKAAEAAIGSRKESK